MGLQSFIIKQYIKHLKTIAEKRHGFQTAAFSQALEPTNSIIGKHATSRDGICQAMSQRWIVMHAHGSSLFNWIYDKNGKIDAAAIASLSVNQIETETVTKGASGTVNQDWNSERYLFSHGLLRRTSILPEIDHGFAHNTRNLITGDKAGGNIFTQMAHGLVSSSKLVTGHYVMIGISGSGGGHCMAAYVGHDIAFFDPNFGEYWFANRQDFSGWLRDALTLPYRIGKINRSFTLREYAPKMGFVQKMDTIGGHRMSGEFS